MNETASLFAILGNFVEQPVADAIERVVRDGSDRDLCRINALAFAEKHGLDEEKTIAGFLHAASIGLFEISWNVLCPGCGGVLDTNASLKTVIKEEYVCALCAAGYSPTLDELVEVTFTVSPRVRRIAGHSPHELPILEYLRQMYWGSGVELPEDNYEEVMDTMVLDSLEVTPGEKAVISLQFPAKFIIVFDAVTHAVQFVDVKGEPTKERQNISMVFDRGHTPQPDAGNAARTCPHRDREPDRGAGVAGGLHRRRQSAQSAAETPAFPDRHTSADQPDLPRPLPCRLAGRCRPAPEDHQPDVPVH
jgi:hypothetical protein